MESDNFVPKLEICVSSAFWLLQQILEGAPKMGG